MRDYHKDMEVCQKATPEPWEGFEDEGVKSKDGYVFETGCGCCTSSHLSSEDAEFIEVSREALPYYIKRCMFLEEQVIEWKERASEQQQLVCNVLKDMEELETKNQELEAKVMQMRDDIEMVIECLEDTKSENMDIAALYIARQSLQAPSPARWEKMQKVVEAAKAASVYFDHLPEGSILIKQFKDSLAELEVD